MSAKGRGTTVEPNEYYATPAKAVHQLLGHVDLPGGRWLEPGAGSGSIIRAVNQVRQDVDWTAVELNPRMKQRLVKTKARTIIANFLHTFVTGKFDLALGNPPFSLAAYFLEHSMQLAPQVVLLLRLNWLGSSSKRRWIFDRYGVPDLFVLEDRPSFVGQGTDATDYAWMRWKRGGQKGTTQIIRGRQ